MYSISHLPKICKYFFNSKNPESFSLIDCTPLFNKGIGKKRSEQTSFAWKTREATLVSPKEEWAQRCLNELTAIPHDQWKLQELGSGLFGSVFLWQKEESPSFAVKIALANHNPTRVALESPSSIDPKRIFEKLPEEPLFVRTYTSQEVGDLTIEVMEYVPGHPLSKFVQREKEEIITYWKKHGGEPSPFEAAQLVVNYAQGMINLLQKNIIPDDLHNGNILVYRNNQGKLNCKCIDFDFFVELKQSTLLDRVSSCFTSKKNEKKHFICKIQEGSLLFNAINIMCDLAALGEKNLYITDRLSEKIQEEFKFTCKSFLLHFHQMDEEDVKNQLLIAFKKTVDLAKTYLSVYYSKQYIY